MRKERKLKFWICPNCGAKHWICPWEDKKFFKCGCGYSCQKPQERDQAIFERAIKDEKPSYLMPIGCMPTLSNLRAKQEQEHPKQSDMKELDRVIRLYESATECQCDTYAQIVLRALYELKERDNPTPTPEMLPSIGEIVRSECPPREKDKFIVRDWDGNLVWSGTLDKLINDLGRLAAYDHEQNAAQKPQPHSIPIPNELNPDIIEQRLIEAAIGCIHGNAIDGYILEPKTINTIDAFNPPDGVQTC